MTLIIALAFVVTLALALILAGCGRMWASAQVAPAHVFTSGSDAREWRSQRSEGICQ